MNIIEHYLYLIDTFIGRKILTKALKLVITYLNILECGVTLVMLDNCYNLPRARKIF